MHLKTVEELIDQVEVLGRSFQRVHAEAAVSNHECKQTFTKLLQLRDAMLLGAADAKEEDRD